MARPMFESAESTCTYRQYNGACSFDLGVAVFFMSYILFVVYTIGNIVIGVLLDEFLKSQAQERQEIYVEATSSNGTIRHLCGPLDPFLKYLSEFLNSDELSQRIADIFSLFDYNTNGSLDFLEVKFGLERLKIHPRIKFLEEDWRNITNDGSLCSADYTLTLSQFQQVMHNQVTLYVQRMASKTLIQVGQKEEDEQSTAFVLKYLVTTIDKLRTTVTSLQGAGV